MLIEKTRISYTFFETSIGRCAIAWSGRGIVGVQLPESTDILTFQRVTERYAGAFELDPPAPVVDAISAITGHLGGNSSDLSSIPLDMNGLSLFRRTVYEESRSIQSGLTSTYGQIADRIGKPRAARAVGQALRHNPFPIVVPCHRVLAAGGRIGGFSAGGGISTKRRVLDIEGAALE